jgi:uncharacterized protein YidB (DUF937 family)
MSFMEDMEQKAMSGVLGSSSNPLAHSVLEMINNHPGGLAGLVQSFHQNGLGGLVNSWISTGQNQPISGDQVQSVLGDEQVQQVAAKLGVSPDVAKTKLAEFLPMIVDKLTPNGQVPQQSNLMEMGMNLLNSFSKTGT